MRAGVQGSHKLSRTGNHVAVRDGPPPCAGGGPPGWNGKGVSRPQRFLAFETVGIGAGLEVDVPSADPAGQRVRHAALAINPGSDGPACVQRRHQRRVAGEASGM
ncbi:hypothetical protein K388_06572 [Streptomyces sp. KhCrAH-43]|nr:hypothetical protein K388_06572 [Streptomyces sp. KhCrAH-43]